MIRWRWRRSWSVVGGVVVVVGGVGVAGVGAVGAVVVCGGVVVGGVGAIGAHGGGVGAVVVRLKKEDKITTESVKSLGSS